MILHRKKRILPTGLRFRMNRLLARLRGQSSRRTIPIVWPEHPDRVDFLNTLVERHAFRSYLEIGCRDDACFSAIRIAHKVGVDPATGGTVRATSDEFFAANTERFDLVFVDGLHLAEQVLKDVRHALVALNPGGVVVLHDCLPLRATAQYRSQSEVSWNGDVWKAMVTIRGWPDADAATCLIDHGVGVVVSRPNTARLELPPSLDFDTLATRYPEWLRTLGYAEALDFTNRVA